MRIHAQQSTQLCQLSNRSIGSTLRFTLTHVYVWDFCLAIDTNKSLWTFQNVRGRPIDLTHPTCPYDCCIEWEHLVRVEFEPRTRRYCAEKVSQNPWHTLCIHVWSAYCCHSTKWCNLYIHMSFLCIWIKAQLWSVTDGPRSQRQVLQCKTWLSYTIMDT